MEIKTLHNIGDTLVYTTNPDTYFVVEQIKTQSNGKTTKIVYGYTHACEIVWVGESFTRPVGE